MDPKELIRDLLTLLSALVASSGFWLVVLKRMELRYNKVESKAIDRLDASMPDLGIKLLMGLAHDKITYLSMKYIEKGWVTKDEFSGLVESLYEPYKEMGGNGSTTRLIDQIKTLPFCKSEEDFFRREGRTK